MNATNTSSALGDLKVEDQADWFLPNLQLVVGARALAKRGVLQPREGAICSQVVFVSGKVTVSF